MHLAIFLIFLFISSGVGTMDYVVCDSDTDPWTEYHVDFIPDGVRSNLNGGIGGYVSQRRFCKRVRPWAPTTDTDVIPILCDLLTVSSPQLHELLRRDLIGRTDP